MTDVCADACTVTVATDADRQSQSADVETRPQTGSPAVGVPSKWFLFHYVSLKNVLFKPKYLI